MSDNMLGNDPEWLEDKRSAAQACKRLRDEATELWKQAKHVDKDEGKQLRAQSKRLRLEANFQDENRRECWPRHKEEFDEFCRRLWHNDPTITTVHPSAAITTLPLPEQTFPCGYARQLGIALRQNTHVTTIKVALKVCVPSVSTRDGRVSTDTITTFVDPLARSIEQSPALRNVTIDNPHEDYEVDNVLENMIVGACLRNRNIEELAVTLIAVPVAAFESCRALTSLKTLSLHVGHLMNQYQGHSLEELQALSGAFQFFPSLTSLDLETLCTSPFYETVLTAVQEAGCRLNELKLGLLINLTPDLFEKIAAILHSFQEFKHLRLGVASFDGPAMTGLTHALKRPGNVPSVTTLTELTFFECSFNRDAIRLLRAFMHTRVEAGFVSSLKKLTLDGTSLVNYQLFWVLNEEFCELQAEDLVAMLSIGRGFGKEAERRAAQDVYPTIGSLVETLVLVNVGHIFLGIFAKHAHLLRLKELSVTVMDGNDVTALAECIAKIKTLRTISIHSDSAGVSLEPVLIRLRHSDNVNALTTNLCSTDGEKKLVMAYCERNRLLDRLLQTSATSTEARDGRLVAAAQDDHSTDAHGGKSISPTLLQTSMDLPRARQSRLIGSLLGLCESIGME